TDVIVKKRKRIFCRARICDATNPVLAKVPGAVPEVISEMVLGESLVRRWRMITPKLGIVSVKAEHRDFILHLNHHNRVRLRIDFFDVVHESAKCRGFLLEYWFVIV